MAAAAAREGRIIFVASPWLSNGIVASAIRLHHGRGVEIAMFVPRGSPRREFILAYLWPAERHGGELFLVRAGGAAHEVHVLAEVESRAQSLPLFGKCLERSLKWLDITPAPP
ncbi:hypothetical protein [Sorangium sp. So ce1000]|uniref:hypothetical protein n=1 Tax=Sorangium sp. So ce1000 TaxID=3133325 RepID=UPI003F608E78